MKNIKMVDVVADILEEKFAPMSCCEIASKMIDDGLYVSRGKTLKNSISSIVGLEIKKLGENSRFVRISPGVVGLNKKLFPDFGKELSEYTEKMEEEDDLPNDVKAAMEEVSIMRQEKRPTFWASVEDYVFRIPGTIINIIYEKLFF